ncbi:MAG: autotransporter outer membrane beta-barrel domain-containing protein, partial [Hafnia sp.]
MQIYKYSLLTSCIYLAITSTNQSLAACNNYAPDSGQIVLCDDSSPNPSLTPITSKDDAINVNVEIVEGSEINTDQAAALTLGDASKITNAGKIVGITGVALRQGTSILNNSGTIIGNTGPGVIFNGSGDNTLINSGTIGSSTGNAIIFGAGSDNLVLNGGIINGGILQGDGADKANISNGIINGSLSQGNGIDDFLMSGGTLGSLQQGDGRDTFTMTGGTIIGAFEDGDVAKMTGGKIGRVDMKLDNNIFDMSGGEIVNNLVTGFGNDRIIVSGDSVIGGNVSVSGGTDSLTITGGTIKGEVRMSAGNDLFHWEEGIILGNVLMGSDNDRVEFTNLDEISASSSPIIDGGEGDDTLVMDNSQYTHSDANILQGIEHIYLKNGSVLTLNKRLLSLGDSSDDNLNTGFDIDSTSYLVVKNSNKTAFNSHLSGAGTISTNTDGNSFNFTSNNEKDNFKGILALGNSTFDLSGLNTSALAQATLKASADSITTVGTGQQNIGGLVFDGGTIDFGSIALGNTLSDRSIQIRGDLNLNGSGVVKIGMESMVNVHPIIPNNVGLLSQDDVNTSVKLVASDGLVIGNGGSLILKDKEDRIITDNITNDILQNGLTVAMGTWDWRLTSGENRDGLYVAYALKQIDLEGAGENALILNSDGATGNASDLSARVTGSGSLAIENAANSIISLSNKKNDYTGVTDIRSGDLLMNNDNVLGNTSLLQMNADTSLDMNGFSQEIGSIDSSQNSQININEGDLKIDFGGSILGHLIGDGLLTLKNGSLSIFGENNSFKAGTNILSNAIINLNSSSGLGVSNIDNAGFLSLNNSDGNLINKLSNTGEVSLVSSDIILKGDNSKFNGTFSIDKNSQLTAKIPEHLGSAAIKNAGIINISPSSSWILNNSISGTGDFVKDGFGTVTLTPASATYTGKTNIQQGSIAFGSRSQQFKLETSEVNINQGSFSGNGSVAGDINNNSLLQVGNNSLIQNNSTQRLGGGGTAINVDTLIVGRNLANNGIIQIGQTGTSAQAGNILAINGNYSSTGGTIVFNTVLGSDNSETDHMLVKGDSSGVTYVSVKNIGGSGAKTLNGIELINIAGKSEGEFQQKGRIVAGAFDYRLGRGVEINQKNWYLTNNTEEPAKPEDPTAPGEPTTPTNPGEPSEPEEPTNPTNPGEP